MFFLLKIAYQDTTISFKTCRFSFGSDDNDSCPMWVAGLVLPHQFSKFLSLRKKEIAMATLSQKSQKKLFSNFSQQTKLQYFSHTLSETSENSFF